MLRQHGRRVRKGESPEGLRAQASRPFPAPVVPTPPRSISDTGDGLPGYTYMECERRIPYRLPRPGGEPMTTLRLIFTWLGMMAIGLSTSVAESALPVQVPKESRGAEELFVG